MGNIMEDNTKKNKKPKKTPRIKHKKLIILFTAILVVATVFIIKMLTTKHYAMAEETDSFEMERPSTGNPLDYTGKENAAICNWVIRHTSEFKTVTTGTVTAKVAVINYDQSIHNTRIVTKDGCYIETISNSSLVKVYEEKYLENNQVVVRKNHSDKYTTITNEVFLEKYGWHPTEFQAYILNEDTILDATIEASGENYILTLTLDPVNATPKKQRETKTVGNAKDVPGYKENILTITLTKDWTPVEVDTYEVYDINMPGIGAIRCKCNMVEIIEYGEFEIPDKDKFKEHITDNPSGNIDDEEKGVISYLQEIFGPLIQGKMNDFDITVDALDTKLEGKLNIELGSKIKVNTKLDEIFVSYQGNDVYLMIGENKYKLDINKVKAYLGSESNSSSALNLDDILVQVNKSQIITSGKNITIKMNLDLMGINAKVDINGVLDGDYYKFVDVNAVVDVYGEQIVLTMKESKSKYVYPTINSSYNDISDMFFIIDEVKELINKPLEITLNTTIKDIDIKASAVYDNGAVSGIINVNDKYDINVYYNNETVYLTFNNLAFMFNIKDINKFTDKEIKLDTTSIKLSDILDVLYTLTITMNGGKAFDVQIDLGKYLDLLKDFKISVSKTDTLNVTIENINLDLTVKETEKEVASNPELEYVNIANLDWLVNDIMNVINYEAYSFVIEGNYENLLINGNVYFDKELNAEGVFSLKYNKYEFNNVKLNFIKDTVYVSYKNIKIKATINEILSLLDDLPAFDIDMLLNNIYLSEGENSLIGLLDLSSESELIGKLNVKINKGLSINVSNESLKLNVKASETTIKTISIDEEEFISLSDLNWLIDDIKEAVEYEAYGINVNVTYKDLTVTGNIYLNKDLEVEAILNINYSGLNVDGITLMYKNKDVYVLVGKTSVKINLDDIKGFIAEINNVFDLNISTDDLDINFDLDEILNSITLNSTTDKLEISANLSSITDILGNVKVSISKGLKLDVTTSDITVNASVTEKANKEVVLPTANINKDEVYLLLEYASQLKEIVQKWRYNIGFELHVNGYDVYAKANIVTFKPEKGLSLYGKVILVKGDKKFYIEASIIDNECYLMFSQTITNFNSDKPINSTTNQFIKFRINFNELIDTAEYAIDALGIDNDTIKMAIAYLGTIVDTNGDFDDLFAEIKEKVTSIDLSMVNDIINIAELELLVDTDNLTIKLGNNTENNLQVFTIFRENGQVKGLDVSEFEINNDILNGHFELLADEDITAANYNGCLNLNGISNLIKAALNNYNAGEIYISGKANMSFIGIGLATVELEAKLDFDYEGKLRGYIHIYTPYVLLATKKKTDTYIYIQNDMVYMKRVAHPLVGLFASDETETRKMNFARFSETAKEQVVWIFNFDSLAGNAILNAESVDIKLEEVLKSYSGKNNTYNVAVNGDNLTGSSAFGEIDLTLTTKTNDDGTLYISTAKVECDIASVLGLELNVTFSEEPNNWNSFPAISTLNAYKAY